NGAGQSLQRERAHGLGVDERFRGAGHARELVREGLDVALDRAEALRAVQDRPQLALHTREDGERLGDLRQLPLSSRLAGLAAERRNFLFHVLLDTAEQRLAGLEAATRFYTGLLGLQVSDRYNESMVPGGMVFLRCNTDHHGVALVGGAPRPGHSTLNHFAFEVGTLDEVFRARAWLLKNGVPIH